MVKKNLRSFAGFEFEKDSSDYKKKFDSIKKIELKSLKSICDILSLERKGLLLLLFCFYYPKEHHRNFLEIYFCLGSKDEIANRVLKFLMEPDESLCVETTAEDEEPEDEDGAEEEEEPEPSEDEKRKSKPSGRSAAASAGGRSTSGRPRRATVGKSKC